jgi:hypothetical protein
MVTDCKAKGLRYLRLTESMCYSQRALFFALLVSCLQPAISQGTCSPGTAPAPALATLRCGGTCGTSSIHCTPTPINGVGSSGTSSGTISDGPGDYLNSDNCWWILDTSPGNEIRISFPTFRTMPEDYVRVVRCHESHCAYGDEDVILMHHGSLDKNNVYTSTTGFLKIFFWANQDFDTGFTAAWSAFGACAACTAGKYSGASSCLDCAAGKYSAAIGASTESMCIACAAGKYSAAIGASSDSTCLDCAAGKYGVLSFSLASGLIGLSNSIALPTLEDWTASGVSQWKVGNVGESCDTACRNSELQCRPNILSRTDMSAILDSLGRTYNYLYESSGPEAPMCDTNYGSSSSASEYCYWNIDIGSVLTQCNKETYANFWRLCACGSSPPTTETSQGVSTCRECVAGKYSLTTAALSDDNCIACGVGKYSTDIGAFYASTCIACVAGKYSAAIGASTDSTCTGCGPASTVGAVLSNTCIDCGANSYSAVVGATGADTCTNCPSDSVSPVGSIALVACICKIGFTGSNGGPCGACAAGKYKVITGDVACTDCGAGKYLLITGATVASSCMDCGAGKYSTTMGASLANTCINCDANSYSSVVGATGSSTCTSCPSDSVSPGGSMTLTACICNIGFTGANGGVCSACAAGSYKPTTGSIACTFCGVDTYSTTVAAVSIASCVACPVNSTSVAGSGSIDKCYCISGYKQTATHDSCIECSDGYYDDDTNRYECSRCSGGFYSSVTGATGIETCKACKPGTWSEIGSPTCQNCPLNSNSSMASAFLSNCRCNAGTTGFDGGTCVYCVEGKYKDTTGSSACIDCPLNSISLSGSSLLTSCQCKAGYTGSNGGTCTSCPAGKYKNSIGSYACTDCGAGKYLITIGATVASSCVDCGAGKYSTTVGASLANTCIDCGANSYSAVVGATGAGTCTSCPSGSVSPGGSSVLTACICNVG